MRETESEGARSRDRGREGPGGEDFKALPEQLINKLGWWGSQRGPFWRGRKLAWGCVKSTGQGSERGGVSLGGPRQPHLTSL